MGYALALLVVVLIIVSSRLLSCIEKIKELEARLDRAEEKAKWQR